jgi:hypothetical protein
MSPGPVPAQPGAAEPGQSSADDFFMAFSLAPDENLFPPGDRRVEGCGISGLGSLLGIAKLPSPRLLQCYARPRVVER